MMIVIYVDAHNSMAECIARLENRYRTRMLQYQYCCNRIITDDGAVIFSIRVTICTILYYSEQLQTRTKNEATRRRGVSIVK